MAKFKADDVKRLANLSRIQISDDQISKYMDDLNAVLSYIDQLKEVDVDGVDPTSQVTGLENVKRADKPKKHVTKKKLLDLAPMHDDDYIKTPRVL